MTNSAKNEPLGNLASLQRSAHAMASWQNAQQYLRNGRHAPALASYRNLVQQFPGVPQLWFELGKAAAGDLDFALADQAFRRAMEVAPADVNLLLALGLQYYRLGRLDQATAC